MRKHERIDFLLFNFVYLTTNFDILPVLGKVVIEGSSHAELLLGPCRHIFGLSLSVALRHVDSLLNASLNLFR